MPENPENTGAGEGNRTLVCSLGSCRSTIELHPRAQGLILYHGPLQPQQTHSAARAAAGASPSFTPRTAYSAATRIASIILTALAFPVPAISNAVP